MDLSICMLAYNGIDFTLPCLASIGPATGRLKVESILVDIGSSDGSPAAVE